MTLPTAEGDEPYEQLVRQQLDALGYDSAAIPDDVRAILTHSARLSCPLLEPPHASALRCCAPFSKTLTTRWSSKKTRALRPL